MNRHEFDSMIGRLDRVLSEILAEAGLEQHDEADRQTLKHHADDLIGVGRTMLMKLEGPRVHDAPPANSELVRMHIGCARDRWHAQNWGAALGFIIEAVYQIEKRTSVKP